MPQTGEPQAPETQEKDDDLIVEPFQNAVNLNIDDPLKDASTTPMQDKDEPRR